MDGLGGRFEVDPGDGQAQPDGGSRVDAVSAENPPQLGQQWVEPGIDRAGVRFAPQGLGHLVARDVAVAVHHQVGEQQASLAARQLGIQPLAVALDAQRPADLDPHRARGGGGHANILAICCR